MADSKPGLTRDGTMQVTAKEGAALLGKHKPDEDAATRGQQKKIDEISSPPPKKAKTAKKPGMKKVNTIQKTADEAKLIYGEKALDLNKGRQTRAQARGDVYKPPMKKAGTMVRTAKEGKAFLKKGKAKAKKEEKADDVNDEEEKKADDE